MHNNFPQGDGILQQDGSRLRTAIFTQPPLAQNNIAVLEWAALSPDLSPIEHWLGELKRRIYAHSQQPTNVHQLREAVLEEWDTISQQVISHFVRSMRRSCLAWTVPQLSIMIIYNSTWSLLSNRLVLYCQVTIWSRKHKRTTPSQAFTKPKQIYRIWRNLKFCGTVH